MEIKSIIIENIDLIVFTVALVNLMVGFKMGRLSAEIKRVRLNYLSSEKMLLHTMMCHSDRISRIEDALGINIGEVPFDLICKEKVIKN